METKLKEIFLYNTEGRKIEKFVPNNDGMVSLYTCGPTVYNYAHIGNLRTYIFEDILKKTLEFNGYNVKHLMNITDIGHLTSDSDEGEDKMLIASQREKRGILDIADFYTKSFVDDTLKLCLKQPNLYCKATEHIQDMIQMIQKIEEKGFTYLNGGNVYFDTSKLRDYGRLRGQNLEDKLSNRHRIDEDAHKRNSGDFVLWFTKSKYEGHILSWESPWGKGYPGWHIECSAMSTRYLGTKIDIHCGGVDHIAIHHTNEIAQSEVANQVKPWVKYWVHGEFLLFKNHEKMSKSGDSFLTLSSLEKSGFNPMDFKYLVLTSHYRKQLLYSVESLDSARKGYNNLKNKAAILKKEGTSSNDILTDKTNYYLNLFLEAVNNDLNTPIALSICWQVLKSDLNAYEKTHLIRRFDSVLGLNLLEEKDETEIPSHIHHLKENRDLARINKEWGLADKYRIQIEEQGFTVKDTKEGTILTSK